MANMSSSELQIDSSKVVDENFEKHIGEKRKVIKVSNAAANLKNRRRITPQREWSHPSSLQQLLDTPFSPSVWKEAPPSTVSNWRICCLQTTVLFLTPARQKCRINRNSSIMSPRTPEWKWIYPKRQGTVLSSDDYPSYWSRQRKS